MMEVSDLKDIQHFFNGSYVFHCIISNVSLRFSTLLSTIVYANSAAQGRILEKFKKKEKRQEEHLDLTSSCV